MLSIRVFLWALFCFAVVDFPLSAAGFQMYSRKVEGPEGAIKKAIPQPNGQMVVATAKGFYQFNSREGVWTKTDILPDTDIATFLITRKGTWIVAKENGGLVRSLDQGKTWETVFSEAVNPVHIKLLAEDGDSAIMAAATEEKEKYDFKKESRYRTDLFLSREEAKADTFRMVKTLPIPIDQLAIRKAGRNIVFVAGDNAYYSNDFGHNFIFQRSFSDALSYGRPRLITLGTYDRIWIHLRNTAMMRCDWDGNNLTKEFLMPNTRNPRHFVRDQRGGVFLFEREKNRVGNAEYRLFDMQPGNPLVWNCNSDIGCGSDFQNVKMILANENNSRHWLVTDAGLFEIGQKRPHRLQIQIVGQGQVSVFNQDTGTLLPIRDNQLHDIDNLGGTYDRIFLGAEAKKGKKFVEWRAANCPENRSEKCSFALKSDAQITAVFED